MLFHGSIELLEGICNRWLKPILMNAADLGGRRTRVRALSHRFFVYRTFQVTLLQVLGRWIVR